MSLPKDAHLVLEQRQAGAIETTALLPLLGIECGEAPLNDADLFKKITKYSVKNEVANHLYFASETPNAKLMLIYNTKFIHAPLRDADVGRPIVHSSLGGGRQVS